MIVSRCNKQRKTTRRERNRQKSKSSRWRRWWLTTRRRSSWDWWHRHGRVGQQLVLSGISNSNSNLVDCSIVRTDISRLWLCCHNSSSNRKYSKKNTSVCYLKDIFCDQDWNWVTTIPVNLRVLYNSWKITILLTTTTSSYCVTMLRHAKTNNKHINCSIRQQKPWKDCQNTQDSNCTSNHAMTITDKLNTAPNCNCQHKPKNK